MKTTYNLAMAAAWDAANRRMGRYGRTQWNRADYRLAAKVCAKLLTN